MRPKRWLTKRHSRARFSIGQGNWAKVPWLAFLDARETDSTQRGVYPAYLFRQDGSGFYLVLAQGVTEPKRELGTAGAHAALAQKAAQLHEYCGPLAEKRVRAQRGCRLALRFWARPGLRSIGGRAQVLQRGARAAQTRSYCRT